MCVVFEQVVVNIIKDELCSQCGEDYVQNMCDYCCDVVVDEVYDWVDCEEDYEIQQQIDFSIV